MSELESNSLIPVEPCKLIPVSLTPSALAEIEQAVALESLLGKVSNAAENQRAVDAQATQNAVLRRIEKARKEAKAPYLEMGRAIDAAADAATEELKKECGRLNALTVPWGVQERRRIAEEAEAQRQELLRVEREKQAEIDRIAREQREREEEARRIQAEADRQVGLAQEAADRAAREATNKKEFEAALVAQEQAARLAETNRLASIKLAEVQKAEAIAVAATVEAIEEKAGAQTYLLSRPIHTDAARGQRLDRDWDIVIIDPFAVAKFHPSVISIPQLTAAIKLSEIKNLLREGIVVKGITATETVNTSVRAKRERAPIEA